MRWGFLAVCFSLKRGGSEIVVLDHCPGELPMADRLEQNK